MWGRTANYNNFNETGGFVASGTPSSLASASTSNWGTGAEGISAAGLLAPSSFPKRISALNATSETIGGDSSSRGLFTQTTGSLCSKSADDSGCTAGPASEFAVATTSSLRRQFLILGKSSKLPGAWYFFLRSFYPPRKASASGDRVSSPTSSAPARAVPRPCGPLAPRRPSGAGGPGSCP